MPIAVVAALVWRQGQLLICQRKPTDPFAGKWEFPGGKIEPGEEPRAALERELLEELGIRAVVGEELWRTEHQYPGHPAVLLLFYAVSVFEGSPQNRVFQQIRWVLARDLAGYDFLEADRPLINKLSAGEIAAPPC